MEEEKQPQQIFLGSKKVNHSAPPLRAPLLTKPEHKLIVESKIGLFGNNKTKDEDESQYESDYVVSEEEVQNKRTRAKNQGRNAKALQQELDLEKKQQMKQLSRRKEYEKKRLPPRKVISRLDQHREKLELIKSKLNMPIETYQDRLNFGMASLEEKFVAGKLQCRDEEKAKIRGFLTDGIKTDGISSSLCNFLLSPY